MRVMSGAIALIMLAFLPNPAWSEDYIALSDLVIYYQPEQTTYRPDHIDATEREMGEDFAVICVIDRHGHLTDCETEAGVATDPGFVRAAIRNIRNWVVADHTRSGEETAGRLVRVVVRFDRRA